MTNQPNTFGERVRYWRLQRGMTQQALANAIGSHRTHVARIEAGQRDPWISTARSIADALGVSLDTLLPPTSEENDV